MFAGAADVCIGSNRRRPGSEDVAGTNGSPHWLAGEGTGRAPPEVRYIQDLKMMMTLVRMNSVLIFPA